MATPVNVTRQANPGPLYAGRFPPAPPVAAPVAEFIGSPTSGTAPFTVTFTDQSTGSVTGWAWDFGDGSSSSSQNPTHNFTAAGSYTVALTATGPGGSNTRTRMAYVSAAAPTVPTTATLSGSESASVGSPHTSRVTLDQPADQTYTITWTRSDSGTGSATSTITAGNTYAEATDTWAAIGTGRTVDFTISPTLTRAGNPLTVNVADFAWAFADAATQARGRNTTTTQATGVPSGAWCYTSPDLQPGETLEVSGSTLQIVGDSTVPTVDDAADVVIEVIETADRHATAQNMRTGLMYGRGASGGNVRIQAAIAAAQDGDTIQISPGYIYVDSGDGSGYLEGSMLAVYKSLTLTNIPGRGRWQLAAPSVPYVDGRSGIVIWEPDQCYSDSGDTLRANPRKTIVIEGFDFSNWGRNSDDQGVKIRRNGSPTDWTAFHESVTFRNFKVGKLPYHPSASGFNGSAEDLIFENGHVYDCGGGISGIAGNDHNFYVSARNLTMRGVRSSRSRANSADGSVDMDGHLAKLTFCQADIQGCVFWCGDDGDSSYGVQCKGGGNLVFRGNLVRGGRNTNTATGELGYVREPGNDGGFAFNSEGCTLLVEKNVFINHRPYFAGTDERGMVYFAPATGFGSSQYLDQALITSCVIRDNIGMSTVPDSVWVKNAPTSWADANWAVSNSVEPYSAAELPWADDDKALKLYRRRYGTIAATGGSVATHRFVWPHGSVARTDAFRGLA